MFVRWKHIIRVQDIQTRTKNGPKPPHGHGCPKWMLIKKILLQPLFMPSLNLQLRVLYLIWKNRQQHIPIVWRTKDVKSNNIPVALELWPLPKHCWPTSSVFEMSSKRSAGVVSRESKGYKRTYWWTKKQCQPCLGKTLSQIRSLFTTHYYKVVLWLIINWVASTSPAFSTCFSNVIPLKKNQEAIPVHLKKRHI